MAHLNYQDSYSAHVAALEAKLGKDDAMRAAVGGDFLAMGKLEYYLLRSLGLRDGHLVVDVGCGSGRLACQLAADSKIRYIGCDIVGRLVEYARELSSRDDWTYTVSNGTEIPCRDGEADFVVFFSVFTHLLHEDTYRYIREAYRCLAPGGRLVFSFLEFRVPSHWDMFIRSVNAGSVGQHLNQFIDRDAIAAWAKYSGFSVEGLFDGDEPRFPIGEDIVWDCGIKLSGQGRLGQSVAVLLKPVRPG